MAYINEERILRQGSPTMTVTKEIQLQIVCVTNCPNNIRFINNPCEKVQLAAIHNDPYCIRYVKYPTDKARRLADELIKKMRR